MRDIKEISMKVLDVIPSSFDGKESLVGQVLDRMDSVNYTAPELMWLRWQEVGEILSSFLGEPDTDWKKEVVNIFSGKDK